MADRITVFTLRIALNERSALAQPRSQVFSPTRRSVGTCTREPWEQVRLLFADFCDGLHLSLFREPVEIFSERLPSGLCRVLPKFKFKKEKKLLSQCLLGLQASTPLVIVFKESPVLVYFWAPPGAGWGCIFTTGLTIMDFIFI